MAEQEIVHGLEAGPVEARSEFRHHLPGVARVVRRIEHPGRPLRTVAHHEGLEDHVVVGSLEGCRRGEDDVGEAGGLVQVDVDGDHEVEALERAGQAFAVGRGEHRVARDGHQRADALVATSVDLLGESRGGQLARELRQPTHARSPAPVVVARTSPGLVPGARGGAREHGAPRAVQVPGEDVHDVDEPARQGPELLGAGADTAIADSALRGGELAGERAGGIGRDPGGVRHLLRSKVARQLAQRLDPAAQCLETSQGDEPLLEEGVDESEEQKRVGAGPDEEVAVRDPGSLAAARMHDHERPAPLAQRTQAARHVGRRHQTAV